MDTMNLPHELALMTPEQVEAVLAFYTAQGIPELRRRQQLVRSQQAVVFPRPASSMNRIAMSNLAIDDELLTEAVSRITWPTEPHTIDVARYLQDR
jgi:predicted nuclease with RNAse H fold